MEKFFNDSDPNRKALLYANKPREEEKKLAIDGDRVKEKLNKKREK